jgi:hypothetical protein
VIAAHSERGGLAAFASHTGTHSSQRQFQGCSSVTSMVSEKSPFLMSVLSVMSEPAWLAEFGLTLALTLEPSLTLESDISPSLMSAVFGLSSRGSSCLTLLTSFLGGFSESYSRALVGVLARGLDTGRD